MKEWLRAARDACEQAFSFLVTDFGYRRVRRGIQHGGLELGYAGAVVGVLVERYPRDTFMVWLHRYFDVGDLEAIKGSHRSLDRRALHAVPTESTARVQADSLRRHGAELLRGDLSDIPRLEQVIAERAAAIRYGRWPPPQ